MADELHDEALARGLASLGTEEAPPVARFEALVHDVRAREEARFRRELRWFLLVSVGVTSAVLLASSQSRTAFVALQVCAAVAAVVVGLRARRAERSAA